tara:strand:+ start:641 stop:775 length:135 start_codon:yes stop_codon:yes gene_type:complete
MNNEIINNIIISILTFLILDLIQFKFGPIDIKNKKGIKKGIINL